MEEETVQTAISLMNKYIPTGTTLTIEQIDSSFCYKYVVRLQYTSLKSGRVMCMVAKGDYLPLSDNDLLRFYLRQLVIPTEDIACEFSRIAWREKRARQEQWLKSGRVKKSDGKDAILVSDVSHQQDNLGYTGFIS